MIFSFNKILCKWRLATAIIPKHRLLCTQTTQPMGKDIVLYKYENPKFFRNLNIFGFSQFVFWTYLSHFSLTLRDVPVDNAANAHKDQLKWYEKINMGEEKYKNGLSFLCFGIGKNFNILHVNSFYRIQFLGYCIMALSWGITLRSVRYLVLRKDGKSVAFVTYTPVGKNRITDANLGHISAQQHRQSVNVHLPIKVKGRWFYFLLDKRGQFPNPSLFDNTVGLSRQL